MEYNVCKRGVSCPKCTLHMCIYVNRERRAWPIHPLRSEKKRENSLLLPLISSHGPMDLERNLILHGKNINPGQV